MSRTYCNIVAPIGPTRSCAAPPGGAAYEYTDKECFKCGLPVCVACSAVTKYRTSKATRRCRLCSVCIEELAQDEARRANRKAKP